MMGLVKPNVIKTNMEDEATKPVALQRLKIIECLSELCRSQAHSFFRSTLLNSKPVFAKVGKYLLTSIRLGNEPLINCYMQMFLNLCLGQDAVAKG